VGRARISYRKRLPLEIARLTNRGGDVLALVDDAALQAEREDGDEGGEEYDECAHRPAPGRICTLPSGSALVRQPRAGGRGRRWAIVMPVHGARQLAQRNEESFKQGGHR
jgi:hypothetical protein